MNVDILLSFILFRSRTLSATMTGRSLRDIRPRRLRDRLRVSLPVFCALFFILSVLHAFAEDRTTRTLRRLQAIDCEAVRLAYEDMAARWPDRFPAHPEWLAELESRRDELLRSIMGDWGPFYGEPAPVAKAEKFLAVVKKACVTQVGLRGY